MSSDSWLTSSPGLGLPSDGLRPVFGEGRGEDELMERMGEWEDPPPTVGEAVAEGVAGAEEGEEEMEEGEGGEVNDDEEIFLGNFKPAFLLILDNGLKMESTWRDKDAWCSQRHVFQLSCTSLIVLHNNPMIHWSSN